ncbi:2-dehydropantoate 2-reductase [Variovorax sp. NFACC27]|jgi:2-dehydropantoate 2-reductase|uniref:2-dehydropantoate 2-reductase n=1 Tax=Variovorax gossypii TaxID=1679495 RepID=A0A431TH88_9BURK|nr:MULTISPECIES: 2-dehydropantoate 2-reductase [Variovorax]MDP9606396.1 2-dehydropantoate 2-reductase [Variovorax paradoxus]SEF35106.1 2-dehydropantoate 2-reductase [Variovorax sp. NFACC28]SEG98642.1 2-dehydropantoate 2-reductase [Variovorax sp. NFACC29]SFE12265.1 2-dehydropantoate 2-reductase [Variovorax sp. NFACC26]SFH18862.1 2-dehydropantoate 2-reductase [Variovorax sp. NFACC27]
MKIYFLGAGALGCAIGGTLAAAGSDVTLIDPFQAHVDAINRDGLRMRVGDSERVVRVRAALDCAKLEPPDLLIVLVKSFHTRAAIEGARDIAGPHTAVMSLQNGMGHEEILSEVVGAGHVLAGKTYVGGVMLGPGHVIAGTQGKRTVIGEIDGRISERAKAIAAEFERAELPCEVSDNILGAMWDKLLINVATGALSGITGQVYGSLYTVPEIEVTAIAAVTEAMTVAEAGGVKLSIKAPRDAWLMAAQGLPYAFKTSMLQSLEKGSITEIDFINGAVVRIGRKYNIPTPVNQTLVAAIKGIERRMEAR